MLILISCLVVLMLPVSCRDIGSIDAYSYLQIEGRIKDMIIRGGENVYPAEIEQFLHTHPKVKEAQVRSNCSNGPTMILYRLYYCGKKNLHTLVVFSGSGRDGHHLKNYQFP